MENLANFLDAKVEAALTNGVEIVGPNDKSITDQERAEIHQRLLGATYGGGHPGSLESFERLMERQISGKMLTWIVFYQEHPVGMVNIEIDGIVAELVRSVELPQGTSLSEDLTYQGQAKISSAMYRRVLDCLNSPLLLEHAKIIEGDVRMAAEIVLPNGNVLPSGVRTQHINHLTGLKPFLLAVPRYQVSPKAGKPHMEMFLQSRLYLSKVVRDPLYLPKESLMAQIADTTYEFAFGEHPQKIESKDNSDGVVELHPVAGEHFSVVYLDGNVNDEDIKEVVREALKRSRFVEVVLPNSPTSFNLHEKLDKMGLIPLGVMPGAVVDTGDYIPTYLHYGILRPELRESIVEIEIARDYEGTPLEKLLHDLRDLWR